MKICLVCSHGGHLSEMLRLVSAFSKEEVALVTYDESFTRTLRNDLISRKYLIEDLTLRLYKYRSRPILGSLILLIHMVVVYFKELRIFLKEKPNVIVSTGSEIAIPMCFLAKMFGRRVIFVESLCRVNELSGTGKMVYPVSDIFLVQWPSMLSRYKRAVYKGNVLNGVGKSKIRTNEKMILVTIGTAPFLRLIRKIDEIAGKIDEKVIMQIGNTKYRPRNAEYFRFFPSSVMERLNERAEVVVCHGGIGSIIAAIEVGTPVVAVPRLKRYGEDYDDHQLETLSVLAGKGLIQAIYDLDDLEVFLTQKSYRKPRLVSRNNVKDVNLLVRFLQSVLSDWGRKRGQVLQYTQYH